jgi:adenylate kinase family enzyme
MDRKAEFVRTLILGNSGSGRSWLSKRLAAVLETDSIDLDDFYWKPGSYDKARDKDLCIEMTRQAASRPSWIIEGVALSEQNWERAHQDLIFQIRPRRCLP